MTASITQILALPVSVLAANTVYGPYESIAVGAAYSQYHLGFQFVSWPASGDVLTVKCERSRDGGNTWAFDASITLSAPNSGTGDWFIPLGVVAGNAMTLGATDLLRFTLTAHQACSVLITAGGML